MKIQKIRNTRNINKYKSSFFFIKTILKKNRFIISNKYNKAIIEI
jgi:hypothetical protein